MFPLKLAARPNPLKTGEKLADMQGLCGGLIWLLSSSETPSCECQILDYGNEISFMMDRLALLRKNTSI